MKAAFVSIATIEVENSDLHWRVEIIDSSMKDLQRPELSISRTYQQPRIAGLPARTHVAGRTLLAGMKWQSLLAFLALSGCTKQVMGWNTPAGRRVLRRPTRPTVDEGSSGSRWLHARFSFAFFQLTAGTNNEMSRKGFLRLCHEAGMPGLCVRGAVMNHRAEGWDSKFRTRSVAILDDIQLFHAVVLRRTL